MNIKKFLRILSLRSQKKGKIILRLKSFHLLPILALLASTANVQSAFAESINPFAEPAPACSGCQGTILQTIEKFSNAFTENIAKIVSVGESYKNYITSFLQPNSEKLMSGRVTASTQTEQQLSNLVNFYLSGMSNKDQETASLGQTVKAIDDVTSPAAKMDFITAVFGNKPPLVADDKTLGTGYMNMDSLIGPLQYDDTQKLDAQMFLRIANSFSAPPDVIHVSNEFRIPYSPDPNSTFEIIKITRDSPVTVEQLKKNLEEDADYRQYKMDYRAAIAARTTYFGSLLRFYQERLQPKSGDPKSFSLAKLEHDSATRRLEKEYYDQMSTAPHAEVEHEILFVLADIHHDLYLLRQQNEQIIALQALTGLQTSQLGSIFGKTKIKNIGKKVYCAVNDPKNLKAPCKPEQATQAGTAGGTPTTPSVESLQAQAPQQ